MFYITSVSFTTLRIVLPFFYKKKYIQILTENFVNTFCLKILPLYLHYIIYLNWYFPFYAKFQSWDKHSLNRKQRCDMTVLCCHPYIVRTRHMILYKINYMLQSVFSLGRSVSSNWLLTQCYYINTHINIFANTYII